jgi:hypothetical protein
MGYHTENHLRILPGQFSHLGNWGRRDFHGRRGSSLGVGTGDGLALLVGLEGARRTHFSQDAGIADALFMKGGFVVVGVVRVLLVLRPVRRRFMETEEIGVVRTAVLMMVV